ncbi:uncharacterized protein METZ01_LOCUS459253, partial [marine metagenome]
MTDACKDTVIADKLGLPETFQELIERGLGRLDKSRHALLFEPEYHPTVLRLVASSDYAASILVREYEWLIEAAKNGELARPLNTDMLAEISSLPGRARGDFKVMQASLRRCRNQRLLHILWRIVAGHDDIWQTLDSLSLLADALIGSSIEFASASLAEEFGEPLNQR